MSIYISKYLRFCILLFYTCYVGKKMLRVHETKNNIWHHRSKNVVKKELAS